MVDTPEHYELASAQDGTGLTWSKVVTSDSFEIVTTTGTITLVSSQNSKSGLIQFSTLTELPAITYTVPDGKKVVSVHVQFSNKYAYGTCRYGISGNIITTEGLPLLLQTVHKIWH